MDLFNILSEKETLLVDNDENLRNSLGFAFRVAHCRLVAVPTAEEGLIVLDNENIEIIISDYRLPGIDGIEFMSRIKNIYPDSVRILISGRADNGITADFRNADADGFIQKPFSVESLVRNIVEMMKRKRDRACNSAFPQRY